MDEEDNVFEIDRVLDTIVKKDIRYYFVRWKGYGEEEDTWEPEENLDDCEEVLKKFWADVPRKKRKRGRKRKLETISFYEQTHSPNTPNSGNGECVCDETMPVLDIKHNCNEQQSTVESSTKDMPEKDIKTKNILHQEENNMADNTSEKVDKLRKDLDCGILEALFSTVLPNPITSKQDNDTGDKNNIINTDRLEKGNGGVNNVLTKIGCNEFDKLNEEMSPEVLDKESQINEHHQVTFVEIKPTVPVKVVENYNTETKNKTEVGVTEQSKLSYENEESVKDSLNNENKKEINLNIFEEREIFNGCTQQNLVNLNSELVECCMSSMNCTSEIGKETPGKQIEPMYSQEVDLKNDFSFSESESASIEKVDDVIVDERMLTKVKSAKNINNGEANLTEILNVSKLAENLPLGTNKSTNKVTDQQLGSELKIDGCDNECVNKVGTSRSQLTTGKGPLMETSSKVASMNVAQIGPTLEPVSIKTSSDLMEMYIKLTESNNLNLDIKTNAELNQELETQCDVEVNNSTPSGDVNLLDNEQTKVPYQSIQEITTEESNIIGLESAKTFDNKINHSPLSQEIVTKNKLGKETEILEDNMLNIEPEFQENTLPNIQRGESGNEGDKVELTITSSESVVDKVPTKTNKDTLKPELSKLFNNLQKMKKKINISSSLLVAKPAIEPQDQDPNVMSEETCSLNSSVNNETDNILLEENKPLVKESLPLLSPVLDNYFSDNTSDTNTEPFLTDIDNVEAVDRKDNKVFKIPVEEHNDSPYVSEEFPLKQIEDDSSEEKQSHCSSLSDFSLTETEKSEEKDGVKSPKSFICEPHKQPLPQTEVSLQELYEPERDDKQPLLIVLSEDSESTEGEPERKKRNDRSLLDSGKPSGKYERTKEKETTEGVCQMSKRTRQNNVYNCDVVSKIIESSSLMKSSKKAKGQDSKGTDTEKGTTKDTDSERHDSDMDLCDSDFEFDLDDYDPVELETKKTVNSDVRGRAAIPSIYSFGDVKRAIKKGDSSTVLAALAGGLDIESRDSVAGMTLLMRAVCTWQDTIVRLLICRGADVNAVDNTGNTPLMFASELGMLSIATLLLDAEVDVNAKQIPSGETALIKACKKGFYSMVSLLISYGADCQMRSQLGLTAAQTAANCGHYDIRDLLDEHHKRLQNYVERAIISCLGHECSMVLPPLLPYVCLYPSEGQTFSYHFNCSNMLIGKTILLYCFRAVFSKDGEVKLSFSEDNGVHIVTLNGTVQTPVLRNNRSVFKLLPKLDTNRLVVETYHAQVHLVLCIYAANLNSDYLRIAQNSVMV